MIALFRVLAVEVGFALFSGATGVLTWLFGAPTPWAQHFALGIWSALTVLFLLILFAGSFMAAWEETK